MLCGGGIDPHAADRIDREHGRGLISVIVLTAAAGMNLRHGTMIMPGMNRVRAMCLIVRHQNSPGP
jgi:hypothetical protein